MSPFNSVLRLALAVAIGSIATFSANEVFAQSKKPNILVIMTDDVGVWNISAYHRGMMGGSTPNIDRIAKEGALFTDYYGQQSCTERGFHLRDSIRHASCVVEPAFVAKSLRFWRFVVITYGLLASSGAKRDSGRLETKNRLGYVGYLVEKKVALCPHG